MSIPMLDQINDKKLIPLRRLTEYGLYKISYLSILVQRKKLKAKKIGRNYYTTIEWFNEYLEKHARDEKRVKVIKTELVKPEIKEFKKEYRKKEYCKKDRQAKIEYLGQELKTVDKKVTENLDKLISYPIFSLSAFSGWRDGFNKARNDLVEVTKSRKKISTIKKVSKSKKLTPLSLRVSFLAGRKVLSDQDKTVNKLVSRPWLAKLITVSIIILISSVSISRYAPDTTDKLTQRFDLIYLFPINSFNYFNPDKKGRVAGISEEEIDFIKQKEKSNLWSNLNKQVTYSREVIDLVNKGSMDILNSIARKQKELSFKTEKKLTALSDTIKNKSVYYEKSLISLTSDLGKEKQVKRAILAKPTIESLRQSYQEVFNFLNGNIKQGYIALLNILNPSQAPQLVEQLPLGEEDGVKQGVVVVSYEDEREVEEIKKTIETMFSDKVHVEPDVTKRAGVIKPVFGKEVAEQEYLYMMVPVNENE